MDEWVGPLIRPLAPPLRQFSGEFHTKCVLWQTEPEQQRSSVWNQFLSSIVSIWMIHHLLPIIIHEVKVVQPCSLICWRKAGRRRLHANAWVDTPCQIIAQPHKTVFTTWHYFETNSRGCSTTWFQVDNGIFIMYKDDWFSLFTNFSEIKNLRYS